MRGYNGCSFYYKKKTGCSARFLVKHVPGYKANFMIYIVKLNTKNGHALAIHAMTIVRILHVVMHAVHVS